MLQAVAAPSPPVEARGALAPLYSSGSEKLKQLRDKGWCKLSGAVPPEKVAELRAGFDAAIEAGGFTGRYADPVTINKPETLPYHFWGLDPVYLPYCDAAMEARDAVRTAFAAEAGVGPETLLASFDAVMATHPTYTTHPAFDPARPRLPVRWDKEKKDRAAGPGHLDQRATNTATADSHQCFLALTPAADKDMSTIMLVPRGAWTLQGMMDACREKFPQAFDPSIKNGGDEGMFFSPDAQEWLIQNGIAKAIKPKMAPGDVLVWSSAVPHCGGAAKPPRGVKRHPRLGIVVGFFPADMVSDAAKEKRRDLVGRKHATGQQVHVPNPHMSWPAAFRYIKGEDWPKVYKDLKALRADVKAGKRPRAYEDAEGDTDAERSAKRRVRSLLG